MIENRLLLTVLTHAVLILGKGGGYPSESLEDWHRRHGILSVD